MVQLCCDCGEIDDDHAKIAGGCSICTLFITSVILFAVSFGTLEPTECGIRYNNNLVTIDESRVYNNGRYFLGLGISFIKFPMDLQHITYIGNTSTAEDGALWAWSKEGQLLNFDIDFWYRLDRQYILNIYHRYGTDWGTVLNKIAVDAIKQIVVLYTAEDFFNKRNQIGVDMKNAVRARYTQEHVLLDILNLRRVGIPDRFEVKIVDKVIQGQLSQTALNIAATNDLRASIAVLRGQGNATVITTLAQATAKATQLIESAKSIGLSRLRQQEAASYQRLQEALGMNGTELLQYRWSQIMGNLEQDLTAKRALKFMVGFQNSLLQIP